MVWLLLPFYAPPHHWTPLRHRRAGLVDELLGEGRFKSLGAPAQVWCRSSGWLDFLPVSFFVPLVTHAHVLGLMCHARAWLVPALMSHEPCVMPMPASPA